MIDFPMDDIKSNLVNGLLEKSIASNICTHFTQRDAENRKLQFSIVVATDEMGGIGKDNSIPWTIKRDLKHFRELTLVSSSPFKSNAVIMGRKTYESILKKGGSHLKGRLNIVITGIAKKAFIGEAIIASSFEEALQTAYRAGSERIFVIGGGQIYAQAINHDACATIYLTRVRGTYACDTFFPKIDDSKFKTVDTGNIEKENGYSFQFKEFQSILRGFSLK